MAAATCPRCDEAVTVPAGVQPETRVACPLCQEELTGEDFIGQLPPALVLLDAAAEVVIEEPQDPAMDDGRVAMWVRVPDHLVVDPAFLAVLGDYVPWGGRDAVGGGLGGGQSLDNTLRVVDPVDTEWIMVDVRIGSLVHGYAHGTVHLWSEDGHLLATASQTCQFRNPRRMDGR